MGYSYRASETVQSSQVTGTLTDFPALFSRTSAGGAGVPDFRTVGNGGHVTDAQGDDLVLFSDVTLSTKLDAETMTYVASTGQVAKFARVPSIATGTVVYWGYGNSAITTSQDSAAAVWNSNYKLAAHYPDGSSLTSPTPDSTSGANNGTVTGATALAGKVDGAAAFASGADLINFGSGVADLTSNWTVSGWFNRNNGNTTDRFGLYSRWTTTSTNRQLFIYFNGTGNGLINIDIPFVVGILSSVTSFSPSSGWNHYAVTRSGSTWSLYLNGNTTPDATATDATAQETGGAVTVGNWVVNQGGAQLVVNGAVDETRAMAAVMTSAWINAEYNNTNAPTSFWGLSTEVDLNNGVRRGLVVRQALKRASLW